MTQMTPEDSEEMFNLENADGQIDGVLSVRFFYPENDQCSRCKEEFAGEERIIRVAHTIKGAMIAAQLCRGCNNIELDGINESGFKAMEVNGHSMLVNVPLQRALAKARAVEAAGLEGDTDG